MTSLSIIIPVYRGAKTIPSLAQQLAEVLPELAEVYELIMVEDDGGDDSWRVIQDLSEHYPGLRGIKIMRNYGQHNALLCGIRAAQYDIVVTMDDELQHPPSEIHKLLHELDHGYDVVYGVPQDRQHSSGRNLGSELVRFALSRAMGVDAARNASAFRAFRTHLRRAFADYHSPYVAIDVLLSWGTVRFGAVGVDHHARTVGTSGYSFRKLAQLAMTMLTGFSALPLRLASYLGFFLTLFGVILLIYIIPVRLWIFGYDVPGFTFLASMISIFSGAQMFTIGIIGEYLARIHFRLMDKPAYAILTESNPHEATNTH
ncbi:MAG: glycosyltransferase family 2 protein [Anaerolineae bacterium]|nr:glycosyltransferase family 2 protein [Anaerolineae bacterium]